MAGFAVGGVATVVSAALPVAVGGLDPAPTPSAPDGYRTVVDDLGVLTVAVPADWQVDTTPAPGIGGAPIPTISAGPVLEPPACEECRAHFPSPSLRLEAREYMPIETPSGPGCTSQQVVPYQDDAGFSGYAEYFHDRPGIGGVTTPGDDTTECDVLFEQLRASYLDALTVELVVYAWEPPGPGEAVAEPDTETAMAVFDTALDTFAWTGVGLDQATGGPSSPGATPVGTGLPPIEPAPDADSWTSLFPYERFTDVPQLGAEPVRGSGCGGNGELGDVIPDGLWAGYVFPAGWETGTVEIDVACVYSGPTAQEVIADGSSTVVDDRDPGFVVVNNSDRRREVVDATAYVLWGVAEGDQCVIGAAWGVPDGGLDEQFEEYTSSLAWVRIDGGAVRWLAYGCDTGFTVGG